MYNRAPDEETNFQDSFRILPRPSESGCILAVQSKSKRMRMECRDRILAARSPGWETSRPYPETTNCPLMRKTQV
jgi:hypothetical protein